MWRATPNAGKEKSISPTIWGLPWRPQISMATDWPLSLSTAEVANVLGEVCENRVIRNNQIFPDVAVGRDDAVHAHGLKGSLGAGPPGDPTHEHDIPVGRVLYRCGAEVGNEVEQIGDAFGILLGPTDRTRGLRPIAGV